MPGEIHSKSPDGRYIIRVNAWEARMSLWVETPDVWDTVANKSLLTFRDSNWSLDHASWENGNIVTMSLRKYPGDHTPPSVAVTLDCVARSATVAGKPVKSLSEIESALDSAIQKR